MILLEPRRMLRVILRRLKRRDTGRESIPKK